MASTTRYDRNRSRPCFSSHPYRFKLTSQRKAKVMAIEEKEEHVLVGAERGLRLNILTGQI